MVYYKINISYNISCLKNTFILSGILENVSQKAPYFKKHVDNGGIKGTIIFMIPR